MDNRRSVSSLQLVVTMCIVLAIALVKSGGAVESDGTSSHDDEAATPTIEHSQREEPAAHADDALDDESQADDVWTKPLPEIPERLPIMDPSWFWGARDLGGPFRDPPIVGMHGGRFADLASFQPPADTPIPPAEPATPTSTPLTSVADALTRPFNAFDVDLFRTTVFGGALLDGFPTDAASLFQSTPAVSAPPRNQINTEMNLRGRRLGTPGRGSYWIPAREDLDTMLSKIDARLVEQIVAINGPYSARYGPGLAFYDLEMLSPPRYAYGFESHGSSILEYKANGDQWNGRQNIWGGSTDWGFRIGYGHRLGSDYETGDGSLMPSSYKSRMPDLALSTDLTENQHVEFRYLRLDQTDVEFAGQMFDMDFLVTDSYDIDYVVENQHHFDRMVIESWYNRTRFQGDNLRPGKRRQIPSLNRFFPRIPIDGTFGRLESETDVDSMSTGFRLSFSWFPTDDFELTAGSDFRYLKQRLNEFNVITFDPPLDPNNPLLLFPIFSTGKNDPIPRSHSSNPGVFAESALAVTERLSIKSGVRVDWVHANADTFVPGAIDFNGPVNLETLLRGQFDQHFSLAAAYVTTEYQVDRHWNLQLAAGEAMRPPTMTQLYAAAPFLSVLPQFAYSTAFGDPNLDAEMLFQVDIGLQANYDSFRGGINGFYAWIEDYVTFDMLEPPNGVEYGYVNTDLATLSGGEIYAELDCNAWLTAFATASYVEGRDHARTSDRSPQATNAADPRSSERDTNGNLVFLSNSPEEPLPTIPPLEGRVGVRLHAPDWDPFWAIELSSRVVDEQDRVALSLAEQTTRGYTTYDLRGYWRACDELLITAGVDNLTDKFYQHYFDTHEGSFSPIRGVADWRNVYQPGTSFYAGVEMTW